MGIVQDCLLGVMLFTKRETFIEKDMVMQLIMNLDDQSDDSIARIFDILPTPAIIKPK